MLLASPAFDIGILECNAAAETICAEDIAAMLWTTHSRVPWSYHPPAQANHPKQCLEINAIGQQTDSSVLNYDTSCYAAPVWAPVINDTTWK